jgi:hypothetical protein
MPLGDFYGGECAAQPGTLVAIDMLHQCCNVGYARAVCSRAAKSDADAVRFLIKRASGNAIEVAWSLERNHHPVSVGISIVPRAATPTEDALELQARAYAASYLRQGQKSP